MGKVSVQSFFSPPQALFFLRKSRYRNKLYIPKIKKQSKCLTTSAIYIHVVSALILLRSFMLLQIAVLLFGYSGCKICSLYHNAGLFCIISLHVGYRKRNQPCSSFKASSFDLVTCSPFQFQGLLEALCFTNRWVHVTLSGIFSDTSVGISY